VALDRGLKLAEECLRKAPSRRWHKAREAIRTAVESDGYDADRGVFVQAFGSKALDAALLLLPSVDFVAYDDPRMLRTADAIRIELDDGHGLIRRYRNDDHLAGQEGAFVTCSFWLAECLARQGAARRRASCSTRWRRVAATSGCSRGVRQRPPGAAGQLPPGAVAPVAHRGHSRPGRAVRARLGGRPAPGPDRGPRVNGDDPTEPRRTTMTIDSVPPGTTG
jgi:hypothetical protein